MACSRGLGAMRHWHAAMRAEPCRRSTGTGPACECLSTGHGTGKPSSADNRGAKAGTKTSRGLSPLQYDIVSSKRQVAILWCANMPVYTSTFLWCLSSPRSMLCRLQMWLPRIC